VGDAARAIDEVGESRALVVGGTGLYLRALTASFFTEPPLDAVQRAALQAELADWPLPRLREEAQRLDPARAHLGRTQLLRVIEVARLTGKRLSDLHREGAVEPRYRARWLVLDPGPGLAGLIESRIDAMLATGWVDEARCLAKSVPESAPAWQGCGYTTVRDIALGLEDIGRGRLGILVSTRQYAKRQRTWFRHQLAGLGAVTRVNPLAADADRQVRRWWESEDA
jgi:tRNA dimethylallyltransferase